MQERDAAPAPTLLAVFAHPDDESYLCGGTLARYAAAGAQVVLVCATRGEARELATPDLATAETLPAVREAELRAAAALLGIAAVHLLDYRDGTLMDVPFLEGVERVAAIMAASPPTIVLTFGPEGVYGHPDHVAVHRWTKEAFLYGGQGPGAGGQEPPGRVTAPPPLAPVGERLYYCAPPRSWYRAVAARCRARGVHDRYGPRADVLGVPDELVTTRLDVAPYAAQRLAAIRAHATQLPANHPFRTLPGADLLDLFSSEWFTRAWPPAARHAPPESDLLAGGPSSAE
ncbi:MAG TPA: PIG-L deacetylase family protein [Chloroflexota bacterium]|nr:PIG-L deacetylase family protein [Chloroflexota bacterium]